MLERIALQRQTEQPDGSPNHPQYRDLRED